jgi:hypothetical protein
MKFLALIVAFAFSCLAAAYFMEPREVGGETVGGDTEPYLKLKAPKEKILESKDVSNVVCEETGDTKTCTDLGLIKEYTYISDEVVTDEYRFDEPGQVYSNERVLEKTATTERIGFTYEKVYKDVDNTVYKIKYKATTTIEEYEKQTKVGFFERLFTRKALAADSFTSDGTYTPPSDGTVDVLIVGGGGSAANPSGGFRPGGGGGGGCILDEDYAVTGGVGLAVVVGAGGTKPGSVSAGNRGASSSFNGIYADGGGGAGNAIGLSGASGGAGAGNTSAGNPAGGTATQPSSPYPGNGNNGGSGFGNATAGLRAGGGGGGCGAVGQDAASDNAGAGGAGTDYSVYFGTGVGESGYFGGGGGGRSNSEDGAGGTGGGGMGRNDDDEAACDGDANTGGGGGGCGGTVAGDGGSGFVILNFTASGGATATTTPLLQVTGDVQFGGDMQLSP